MLRLFKYNANNENVPEECTMEDRSPPLTFRGEAGKSKSTNCGNTLFNTLLNSRFGVHHHITYMFIYRHIKIHQTFLYRIIRDYIHLKIHKNYHN